MSSEIGHGDDLPLRHLPAHVPGRLPDAADGAQATNIKLARTEPSAEKADAERADVRSSRNRHRLAFNFHPKQLRGLLQWHPQDYGATGFQSAGYISRNARRSSSVTGKYRG